MSGPAPSPRPAEAPSAQLALEFELEPGRRVTVGGRQIALLRAVREHGSISAAARSLRLSFRGAWLMLDNLERCLGGPLLRREVGGARGGGAAVTVRAERLLVLVAEIEADLRYGLERLRATEDAAGTPPAA